MLVVIGVVTAFATVLLTEVTDGLSWIFGPLIAIGLVVISDLREALDFKVIMVDAVTLGVILMIGLPIAFVAIIFLAWAL